MNLGPTELVLIVIGLIPLAIGVWAIVDAAQQPERAWNATGKSRVTWIVLIAVFTFFCSIVGLVLSIVYLASIRPQLRAAAT
jgi:cadmium resistance protein CadD (predicted permease)